MRKTVSVVCAGCSKEFEKALSEVNRAVKRGFLSHYCSNKCQRLHGPINPKGNSVNLKKGGRIPNELSPFRYYAGKAKARNKQYGFEVPAITVEYLKEIWNSQNGKCPLTGWNLVLPESISYWSRGSATRKDIASLDRIKAKEPYTIGNVRFIAHIANMAKHTYTDQDVIDFCKAVVDYQ